MTAFDMAEEPAGILLEVAWPWRRLPARCRFNRLNELVNLDGWRVRGSLIAVENGPVSSNVAVMGTQAFW